MAKRRIDWKRVLVLLGALLAACVLVIVLLLTLGRPLLSQFRAARWTADPQAARQAAQAMLDYKLPPGFNEKKLLRAGGQDVAVMIAPADPAQGLILLQTVVDGVRQNQSWRQRYEESWADDLEVHRYQVQTVALEERQVGGERLPLRLLEGSDESGRRVKQAVCILPGKGRDVLVGFMLPAESWDPRLVEFFFGSIGAP